MLARSDKDGAFGATAIMKLQQESAQLQMKTSRLETQASRAKQELEKARARGDEYQEKWGILQVCLNTDCLGPRLLCWLISCSVV